MLWINITYAFWPLPILIILLTLPTLETALLWGHFLVEAQLPLNLLSLKKLNSLSSCILGDSMYFVPAVGGADSLKGVLGRALPYQHAEGGW